MRLLRLQQLPCPAADPKYCSVNFPLLPGLVAASATAASAEEAVRVQNTVCCGDMYRT